MFRFIFSLFIFVFLSSPLCAKIIVKGDFEQGSLIYGKAEKGAVVRFNGKRVLSDVNGAFVVGLSRDEKKQNFITVEKKDGTGEIKEITVAKRNWIIQKINGLPKNKVNPSAAEYKRIIAENGLIKKARAQAKSNPFFKNKCFIQPAKGRISSVFGSQRILNGQKKSPHSGVDIAAPIGTVVKAASDGVVSLVHQDMFYTGKTVMINHGLGLQTVYIHMNAIKVKKGQKVKQGDVIGEVGTTGRSTGPHLHWGVSWFNVKLDPQKVVSKPCYILSPQ
jgi:murein DD-endopeptidase MepM/ murein hydrolase activator NlpD